MYQPPCRDYLLTSQYFHHKECVNLILFACCRLRIGGNVYYPCIKGVKWDIMQRNPEPISSKKRAHQNDIGCTSRYWEKRLAEHTHRSALTGKPLSGAQVFAPLQHVKSEKCNPAGPIVTRDDFEIIGHDKDRYLLQVKESLLIKEGEQLLKPKCYIIC